MKLSPILIAAAVAFGGSAFAQTRSDSDAAKRTASQRQAKDDRSVADKTRSGAQRVGEATRSGAKRAAGATGNVARRGAETLRNTGQAIERRLPGTNQQAQRGSDRDPSRAMGAGPATAAANDRGDSDRRARMDDAYDNWKQQSRR